jgi:hypothetical protein
MHMDKLRAALAERAENFEHDIVDRVEGVFGRRSRSHSRTREDDPEHGRRDLQHHAEDQAGLPVEEHDPGSDEEEGWASDVDADAAVGPPPQTSTTLLTPPSRSKSPKMKASGSSGSGRRKPPKLGSAPPPSSSSKSKKSPGRKRDSMRKGLLMLGGGGGGERGRSRDVVLSGATSPVDEHAPPIYVSDSAPTQHEENSPPVVSPAGSVKTSVVPASPPTSPRQGHGQARSPRPHLRHSRIDSLMSLRSLPSSREVSPSRSVRFFDERHNFVGGHTYGDSNPGSPLSGSRPGSSPGTPRRSASPLPSAGTSARGSDDEHTSTSAHDSRT